jgi:hypothetical protein
MQKTIVAYGVYNCLPKRLGTIGGWTLVAGRTVRLDARWLIA